MSKKPPAKKPAKKLCWCKECRVKDDRISELRAMAREARDDKEYAERYRDDYKAAYIGLIAWNVLALGMIALCAIGWVVFT